MRGRAPHDVGEVSGSEDAAPSPGRASRTAAIQRRASASLPMSASPSPVARAVADDPFALHLPTAPIQARLSLAPAAEAAAPATPSSGQPLEPALRADMERGFGADFGSVRVHQGGEAAALGAVAYTQGESVHFQPGAYDPGSASGRELVGHELAHVVQQREGRVATPQAKGAPINADPALEAEADDLGGRVARGEVVAQGSGATAAAPGVVQRKLTLGDLEEPSTDQILDAMTEVGVVANARNIYLQVLETKPDAIKKNPRITDVEVDKREVLHEMVEAWRTFEPTPPEPPERQSKQEELAPQQPAKPYQYQRDVPSCTTLLKHTFKYFLHAKHNWRSIGVAQYMTGDATGLALAPLVDPSLTIKILTGDQRKGEGNKRVEGPSFVGSEGQLPGYFEGATQQGNIVLSDTNNKDEFQGTSDRYAKVYNQYGDKDQPVLPWNKETYEATRVIGEAYAQGQGDIIRQQLQLGDSEHDQTAKLKIGEYKQQKLDPAIGGRPCVILWGRTSGKKGGAHKELDSHKEMLVQLATTMRDSFPGHQIVIVGDPVLTPEDLSGIGLANPALFLGEFWKDEHYGEHLKDRNAQRYLFQLFHEQNQAVSIGMRSGSLEGMALLGLRVIFLDDQGNNAAGRMEYWAGSGAKERSAKVREGAAEQQLTEHEEEHAGPMANYKRVATYHLLGDQIDARRGLLKKAETLFKELLEGTDGEEQPLCNDEGDEKGNELTASFGDDGGAFKDSLFAGQMPEEPDTCRAFLEQLETTVNGILAVSYRGVKAEFRRPYVLHDGDFARVHGAVTEELGGTVKGQQAKEHLETFATLKDLRGAPLVCDEPTSETAQKLLGALWVKAGHQPLAEPDTDYFVGAFPRQQRGMVGKEIAAVAGKAKFKRARIQGLANAVALLSSRNVLQPDELQQIAFLTKHLQTK